jgi:dipeptidase E
MKLILGSDLTFLLKYGYGLTGIPKDQMKIGYVTTASKGNSEKGKLFAEKIKNIIKENNYFFEEIDIKGKSKDELRNFFKDKNVIHIEGGNTFYLLKAIRETGFDEILKELLNEGKIYVGTSAGASIIGPTIEFSSYLPENTSEEELKGLNLVPFILKAHYGDEKEKTYREKIKTLKYPLRILRDGQGILVEDGKYTFVGDGEEVELQ